MTTCGTARREHSQPGSRGRCGRNQDRYRGVLERCRPSGTACSRIVPQREYPGLAAIASEFLDRTNLPVVAACFDVAGPVVSGQAVVTNLPWVVSEGALRDALSIDAIRLLTISKPLRSQFPSCRDIELHTLSPGRPVPGGVVAVIAPDTGLGEAFLTRDGANYHAHASGGGHTDFGPTSDDQIALLTQLPQRYDHVSYELVCSGGSRFCARTSRRPAA
jgi:glucokinase